jgi:monovalent cation:H+ antiporter-2, CPA2 family
MPHDTILIATVAAGLGVAFVFGLLAVRLKLPPTVGYLVAGIVVGPFTPGYVADAGLASQLAEVGVILLMFGVGLHFSLADLVAVRRVVVPGSLLQTALTATLGGVLGHLWGLGWGGAVVLGLSLGVASTAVLLKGLEGRDRLDSPEGRLAIGWLVVEDVTMVLALVLLPALAPMLGGVPAEGIAEPARSVPLSLVVAIVKVAIFVALVVFVGRRWVPWLLEHVAKLGSRELFTLAVLGTALGVGTIAANLFGVSFALGAFFAGAVINESELSHRAAAEALPMQDAFAVLFFVSVGMLFDPSVLTEHPMRLLAIVGVIVVWKSAIAFGLVRLLGENARTALLVGTSLGQIGEFSFIVAALGVSLGLITRDVQAMIVAAAIIAITVNGGALRVAVRLAQGIVDRASAVASDAAVTGRAERAEREQIAIDEGIPEAYDFSDLRGQVVLIGYGRVGATVAEALARAAIPFVVVEEQERIVGGLRKRGERAILGDATRADVLERAGIQGARLLLVTAPEPFRAHRIVELAREASPEISVAVRTHSAAEQAHFEKFLLAPGATGRAVYAEREAALSLAHYALVSLGRSDDEADWVISALRGLPTAPTETFRSMLTQELRTPR